MALIQTSRRCSVLPQMGIKGTDGRYWITLVSEDLERDSSKRPGYRDGWLLRLSTAGRL